MRSHRQMCESAVVYSCLEEIGRIQERHLSMSRIQERTCVRISEKRGNLVNGARTKSRLAPVNLEKQRTLPLGCLRLAAA